jgi:hypothetical protein
VSDPDVVSIFKKAGKGIGNVFKSKDKPDAQRAPLTEKDKPDTVPQAPSSEVADHGFSYGVVYANEIAAAEINKSSHKFPVGSMIVRERLDSLTAVSPTVVIAMVKRESGFSKGTGDWEFFSFTGTDLKLLSRQTAGSCAECHTKKRDADWVFLDYLKKQ